MTRFALIEMNSGFVWWVGESATQCGACERAHREINREDVRFEPISEHEATRTTGGGFAVYAVPEGFDVNDGQAPADIAAVERESLQGYCRRVRED